MRAISIAMCMMCVCVSSWIQLCLFFVSYEVPEFQQKVMKVFERLMDNTYWKQIDANKPFNDLQNELLTHVETAIDSCRESELNKLW